MLPQDALIGRLAQICQEDERLLAAMHYGSLARGEEDIYSDLDIMLFFADEAAAEIDQRAWLSQIAPVELFYVNEFGNSVAIFDNLVRGEFHFDPAGEMAKLAEYGDRIRYPALESTLLVDKSGRLAALDHAALQSAYQACWDWGNEMLVELGRRYELILPVRLIRRINGLLGLDAVDSEALKAE